MNKGHIVLLTMILTAVPIIFASSCGRSTTVPTTTYAVTPVPYTIDPSRGVDAPWLNMATYVDPAQTVAVRVGDRFAIGLYVNPRVGDHWVVDFDDAFLDNPDQEVVMIDPATPVDGTAWFLFNALKGGHTEVSFRLLHTDERLRAVTSFEVTISPSP